MWFISSINILIGCMVHVSPPHQLTHTSFLVPLYASYFFFFFCHTWLPNHLQVFFLRHQQLELSFISLTLQYHLHSGCSVFITLQPLFWVSTAATSRKASTSFFFQKKITLLCNVMCSFVRIVFSRRLCLIIGLITDTVPMVLTFNKLILGIQL